MKEVLCDMNAQLTDDGIYKIHVSGEPEVVLSLFSDLVKGITEGLVSDGYDLPTAMRLIHKATQDGISLLFEELAEV